MFAQTESRAVQSGCDRLLDKVKRPEPSNVSKSNCVIETTLFKDETEINCTWGT